MNVQFKQYQCETNFAQYHDGSIAILLRGKPGTNYQYAPIATATVYVQKTAENVVGIKNWSENKGMAQALIAAGVIKDKLLYKLPTGYVEAEYYELTDAALEEISKLKEGA